MQFKVPQFIDIEDQIIGPLTIKQFLYLVAGMILLAILWYFLKLAAFIIVAIPIATFFGALAFYKYQGRPFVNLIGSLISYLTKPRLYLWKKEDKK